MRYTVCNYYISRFAKCYPPAGESEAASPSPVPPPGSRDFRCLGAAGLSALSRKRLRFWGRFSNSLQRCLSPPSCKFMHRLRRLVLRRRNQRAPLRRSGFLSPRSSGTSPSHQQQATGLHPRHPGMLPCEKIVLARTRARVFAFIATIKPAVFFFPPSFGLKRNLFALGLRGDFAARSSRRGHRTER